MKKTFVFIVLLSAFLFFFVWNSSWHRASRLVIRGWVESPVNVRISWDSGSGFNEMESTDLVFGRPVEPKYENGFVGIRRMGKRHPSARSTEVLVKALKRSENDRTGLSDTLSRLKNVEMTAEGYLRLRAGGSEIRVPAGSDFTAICFATNEYAGFVEIDHDGDRRVYDLYAEQPGEKWVEVGNRIYSGGDFVAGMELPRYDFRRLKIVSGEPLQTFRLKSVTVASARGDINLPLIGEGFRSSVGFSDIPRNTRQYFDPVRLFQQFVFAILSASTVLAVFRFVRIRGGLIEIMTAEKRPVFWLMFIGAVVVFGSWLLCYWPGHFTTDSIHIWWAAKQPGYFLHDHPVMNVIYYRFLQQFWDHFAVVGIVQILLTSLLGCYIFYRLHKRGVSWYIILPFYLLFVTSIPVGLYTISLWKDIPFALLVVFWAFRFVQLGFEKREGIHRHSRTEKIVLTLLLIALALFRYNGLVYLLIVPFGLVLLGMIPPRKVLIGSIGVLISAALLVGLVAILDKTGFFADRSRFFIERLGKTGVVETVKQIAEQYPTVLDVNIIKKRPIWYDTWYRDSGVTRWHYDFARKKGYNQWIRYMPCEPKSDILYGFLHPLNLKSTTDPWVYFTWNPFYMLLIFPVCFLYRIFPTTAGYGYIVLSQVFTLLLVLGPYNYNWRYYYFLLLSLYFLIPIAAFDVRRLRRGFQADEGGGKKGRWFACLRSA